MATLPHKVGDTFLVSGSWKSGDPFTANTTLTCMMRNGAFTHGFEVRITDFDLREFEIYASASETADWKPNVNYVADIQRSDPSPDRAEAFVVSTETFIIQTQAEVSL